MSNKKRILVVLLVLGLIFTGTGLEVRAAQGGDGFYTSRGVNVRNMKGELIGYLEAGDVFEARSQGDYLLSVYKEERVKIHKKFARQGICGTYRSLGANVRDSKGKKLGRLGVNKKIVGNLDPSYRDGSYVGFNYKGKKAYVHMNFLSPDFNNMNRYRSKGAKIRDVNGKDLGRLKKNRRIDGYPLGDKIYFNYRGKTASIHSSYGQLLEGKNGSLFFSRGAVIRDGQGNYMGRLSLNDYIYGRKTSDGKIHFNYGGEKVTVTSKFMTESKTKINLDKWKDKPARKKSNESIKIDLGGEKLNLSGQIDWQATEAMYSRVNEIRQENGLRTLKKMNEGDRELLIRSLETDYMVTKHGLEAGHDRPNGENILDLFSNLSKNSTSIWSENLAFTNYEEGRKLGRIMTDNLYQSQVHRENMLRKDASHIGLMVIHTEARKIGLQIIY